MVPRPFALLEVDEWDDFGFRTQYSLSVVDSGGRMHEIGAVKIGRRGMSVATDDIRPRIPEDFTQLSAEYFSVGQEDLYYAQLADVGGWIRQQVLTGLRDMAYAPEILEEVSSEDVAHRSLWRVVKPNLIQTQFARLAQHGGSRVLSFRVAYHLPGPDGDDGLHLTFHARPEHRPPHNIHVLTGRNGVGKSFLLNKLVLAAVDPQADPDEVGSIDEVGRAKFRSFTNLVYVSFSAFDDLPSFPEVRRMPVSRIDLRVQGKSGSPRLKTPTALLKEFAEGAEACLSGGYRDRWTSALETLAYGGSGLLPPDWIEQFLASTSETVRNRKARALFRNLSSGHKIVLLAITKLVELVGERTLVIIDEPETHLHPPLLSALVRAISDLLTERNALAIVATHSPVVLQEVPASCVYKLRRYDNLLVADRPTQETFGESIGILTQEVFGLEVTNSGFHHAIAQLVAQGRTYEGIMDEYGGNLGGEARILARSLVATHRVGRARGEDLR
ncbi:MULTISPECIES: AAA family ATPase [unclassified Kitasatospora]|uniref:AAA family ATPase n=1 Tax=unclassified Kitasatospora TaxID=2633591 RepID=UPI001F1DB7B9|nr:MULTISPECIES: AAA family ATPase [unclassified Kitasatospora]